MFRFGQVDALKLIIATLLWYAWFNIYGRMALTSQIGTPPRSQETGK